jgi:hypothetical protein
VKGEVSKRGLGLRAILSLILLVLLSFGGLERADWAQEGFQQLMPLWEPSWSPRMLLPGSVPGYPDNFRALAAGDFNGDQRVELIAAGSMLHILAWVEAELDEQLLPEIEIDGIEDLIAADMNTDRKLDLVIGAFGGKVWVLLGDGRGGFQLSSQSPLILEELQFIKALVSGDFSGDGMLDIAVVGYDATQAYLLLGDGLGGFTQRLVLTGAEGKTGALKAYDLYGDGRVEILVLTDKGLWLFPPTSLEGRLVREDLAGQALAIADLTRDGNPDLAVGQGDDLVLLAGLGGANFNFNEVARWRGDFSISWVLAADFRGEGTPELVVGSSSGEIAVLAVNADGSLSGPARYGFLDLNGVPRQSLSALAADLSGDGRAELIVQLGPWAALGVLTPTPMGRSLQGVPGAFLLAALDWDQDRSPDLLSDNLEGGLAVLVNNGLGVFQSRRLPLPTIGYQQPTPYLAREADLDGDGDQDLVVWSFLSSYWYPASVTSLIRERDSLELGWHQPIAGEVRPLLAVLDLTGDGWPEVVTAAGEEIIILQGGAGKPVEHHLPWGGPVGPLTAVELGEGPGLVAGFKVPPAGRPELVLLKGLNLEPTGLLTEVAPLDLASTDLDGDGLQDLVAIGLRSVTGTAGQVSLEVALAVFWGGADGKFTPEVFPIPDWPVDALPFPYGGLAVGDFNGDGLQDLAVMWLAGKGGTPGGIVVLPNKGGKFKDFALVEACAGMRLLTGDFDGDGRVEFATSTLSTPIFLCLTAWR